MIFQLTEEQLMIQQAARDFAQHECLPGVIERDEKQQFPRFVIGESLLPHCMDFLEEAGLLDAVAEWIPSVMCWLWKKSARWIPV